MSHLLTQAGLPGLSVLQVVRRQSVLEHLAIKFEQSYLAENEEALLTAGYVRTRPSNQGYNRGRAL